MRTRDLILTALFAALTAIGAFLRIPVGASSFTLQNFFCVMAGLVLGAKYGALSQAVYVLLGLAGVPVFTTGGGLMYVFQPTFGFLLALIPAAWIVGWMTRKGTGFRQVLAAGAVGMAVIYVIGLPYMHLILTVYLSKEWTLWQTVRGGMLIFLPWDALKAVAAAWLGSQICHRMGDRLTSR